MRTIIAILGVLLVLLQIQVWRQFAYVAELEQRVDAQRDENRRLAERNNALDAEVRDLKSGLDAVEERARAELGLIRAGEKFYMVVEPEDLNPDDVRALKELRASEARRLDDAERRGESVEPDEGG